MRRLMQFEQLSEYTTQIHIHTARNLINILEWKELAKAQFVFVS
jgi:hypothetical protein